MATASTMNWTNRVISRVNRKKIATIPTKPRNNGPNRPCRYVTRFCVLRATGTIAAATGVVIGPPFRDQVAIRLLRDPHRAGEPGAPTRAPAAAAGSRGSAGGAGGGPGGGRGGAR